MKQKDIAKLIQSYLVGTCSERERTLVERHFLHYLEKSTTTPTTQQVEQSFGDTYAAIEAELDKKNRFPRVWIRYAAAAVLILGTIGIWFTLVQQNKVVDQQTIIDELVPGSNRATLIFDNGKQVDLSSDKSGILIEADGAQQIVYSDGTPLIGNADLGNQQTLITPRGGTYQVTLPDGTQVWLNADSRLTYPTHFHEKERVVSLEGEAYFAVTKQANKTNAARKPFKVITPNQVINVLGTEFNVKAYPDEREEKTILVEGSVRVSLDQAKERQYRDLVPGQQSIISPGNISVQQADVFTATAWKNGRFSFDGKSFAEIIKELARWYNFDVTFEGPIPDAQFMGGAFHTDKISTVLRFLESGNIHYRLEKDENGGNRLVILNRKEASP